VLLNRARETLQALAVAVAPADRERLKNSYARALQLTALTVAARREHGFRRKLLRELRRWPPLRRDASLTRMTVDPAPSGGCATPGSPPAPDRTRHLRDALRLEYLTVGWNVIECVVAVTAALAARSVALLGFGLDSFVETASALVLVWRLTTERDAAAAGRALDRAALERLDRRAHRLVGLSLITLGGIGFNLLFGWWWADPLAALSMTWFLAAEGREAWRGEDCGCR
jgi:hypothetical protein